VVGVWLGAGACMAGEPPVVEESGPAPAAQEQQADPEKESRVDPAQGPFIHYNGTGYPYFLEINNTVGEVLARLNTTRGPLSLDLVRTAAKTGGYEMNSTDRYKRDIAVLGRHAFTADHCDVLPTAVRSSTGKNGTKLEITLQYKMTNQTKDAVFTVEKATVKLTIEWGVPSRADYWNLTAASLSTLTGTYNKTAAGTGNETEAVNLKDLDLTPQFSYTNSSHDYGCESGAGLCAPVGLCWSCGDQVLRPARQYQGSPLKPSQLSVFLHMPGLLLEPAWPTEGNSTWRGFSANWDCEPLIPISIWVGILVGLLLASILLWAVQMLTDLQVPNKWDDPKGPGIHVPQAE